jgi:hypothetical protein
MTEPIYDLELHQLLSVKEERSWAFSRIWTRGTKAQRRPA